MIIGKDEVPLQYLYRTLCADIKLHHECFCLKDDFTGYCIDAPVELVPSGSCVNDGSPKQGCVFTA